MSKACLAVKGSYTFDFLELADEHSERQLEAAILARVEPDLELHGHGNSNWNKPVCPSPEPDDN